MAEDAMADKPSGNEDKSVKVDPVKESDNIKEAKQQVESDKQKDNDNNDAKNSNKKDSSAPPSPTKPKHRISLSPPPTKPKDPTKLLRPTSTSSTSSSSSSSSSDGPAGGFDDTPFPNHTPGYTIKFTIHYAENLPMADINTLSSDPYVVTQLYTDLPTRHKEDPPLQWRTPTIRKDINPTWNATWIVGNIPSTGFRLKFRIYDEDPSNHDDRLGNAHYDFDPSTPLSESWPGFTNKKLKVKKRMGSKRAYVVQGIAMAIGQRNSMHGWLCVSAEVVGKTRSSTGARAYTVGPLWFTKHYSPVLGLMVGRKTPREEGREDEDDEGTKEVNKAQRYNFQAIQMQLHGPIPAPLYHRYVEFKPFVKRMYTSSGLQGFFLHKALSHQHAQIYHFDRSTEWGYLGTEPTSRVTEKFLELVHWDQGGRIFTYVLTLDSLMRFTETGKEFGIDMLSKHTMHSNVSVYVAFSGEFFVRRRKGWKRGSKAKSHKRQWSRDHPQSPNSPGSPLSNHSKGSWPWKHKKNNSSGSIWSHHSHKDNEDSPPRDPSAYELIIDNDSGTYRPNADLLPVLKQFLTYNLPGLKIITLDCQADAEVQQKLKDQQRKRKEEEGQRIFYRQTSFSDDEGSISSSDEEGLRSMARIGSVEPGFLKTVRRDVGGSGTRRLRYWKGVVRGRGRFDDYPDDEEGGLNHNNTNNSKPKKKKDEKEDRAKRKAREERETIKEEERFKQETEEAANFDPEADPTTEPIHKKNADVREELQPINGDPKRSRADSKAKLKNPVTGENIALGHEHAHPNHHHHHPHPHQGHHHHHNSQEEGGAKGGKEDEEGGLSPVERTETEMFFEKSIKERGK